MRTTWGPLSIFSFSIALVVACKEKAPTGELHQVTSSREALVERGAYVARVSGCGDCHTPGGLYGAPDPSRTLAGSELGWQGPWGTSYAPNLTPDVETGLGKWSEADIVRAVRTGVRNDGRKLLPPMPWSDYASFTDADVYALAAYLKSLPAVSHKSPSPRPPGEPAQGPVVPIPPPPAWDAPRAPAIGGGPRP